MLQSSPNSALFSWRSPVPMLRGMASWRLMSFYFQWRLSMRSRRGVMLLVAGFLMFVFLNFGPVFSPFLHNLFEPLYCDSGESLVISSVRTRGDETNTEILYHCQSADGALTPASRQPTLIMVAFSLAPIFIGAIIV